MMPGTALRDEDRMLQARKELDQVRASRAGVAEVARLRVRATVRNVDREWVEIRLQVKRSSDSPWLDLLPEDNPMLMARQFSGRDYDREAPELYACSALRMVLGSRGADVLELAGSEARVGHGVTEWRYWARLGSRFSVALQSQADGTVAVVGVL